MKRILSIVVIALCCGCTSPSPQPSPHGGGSYTHIVSLKPNITEILFALGVGDRVVGVTTWCNYPPAATKLPKVADYLRPFSERIAAVHPDLIIGSRENSERQTTEALESLGAPVHYFSFRTIAETAQSIREIGALIGEKSAGEKLAQTLARLTSSSPATGKELKAVAIVGYRPLIAVGSGTFLSDVMAAAGFRNIITDGSLPYPQLSLERLLALNPDVILDMTMGTEVSSNFWNQLPHGHVIMLSMDDFHAGPRLPLAVATLTRLAHPK